MDEHVVVSIVMLAVFAVFAVLAVRQARHLPGTNQAVLIGSAVVVAFLNGYALYAGSTETSLVATVLTAVNIVFLTKTVHEADADRERASEQRE